MSKAPTQEAMKAAQAIEEAGYQIRGGTQKEMAEIIDRETNLPALLESRQNLMAVLQRSHTYFLQNDRLTADDWQVLDEMGTALAAARKVRL